MKLQQAAVGEQAKEVDLGYSPPAIPYFNGINDRINIPYSADFNPTASFTVEMWVRFQGGRGYRAVLSSVSGSAKQGRRGYLFCVNLVGQWQFWVGTGKIGAPWVALTGSLAKVEVWTHLAGSYDSVSQTVSLYVNGKLAGQRTGTPFLPNNRNPMHVGAGATEQPGASSCFFHGLITKVRIWNRALSLAEIQLLAAPGRPDAAPQTIPPTQPSSGTGTGTTGSGTGTTGAGTGTTGTGTGTTGSGTGTTGAGTGTTGTSTGTGTTGAGTGTTGTGSGTGTTGTDSGTSTGSTGTGSGTGTGTPGSGTSSGTGTPGSGTSSGTGTGTPGSGTSSGTGTGTPGSGTSSGTGTGTPGSGTGLGTGTGSTGTGSGTGTGSTGTGSGTSTGSTGTGSGTSTGSTGTGSGTSTGSTGTGSGTSTGTTGTSTGTGTTGAGTGTTGAGTGTGTTGTSTGTGTTGAGTGTGTTGAGTGTTESGTGTGTTGAGTGTTGTGSGTGTTGAGTGTTGAGTGTTGTGSGTGTTGAGTGTGTTGTSTGTGTTGAGTGTTGAGTGTGTTGAGTGTTGAGTGTTGAGTGTTGTSTGTGTTGSGTGTSGTSTGTGTGTTESGTGTTGSGTGTTGSGTGTTGSGTGTTGTGTGTTDSGTGTTDSGTGTTGTGTEEKPTTPPVKSVQSVLVFDGRDDYVEIKDPFKNNTTFTISLWVKPSALNDGTWHGILGKRWGELCSKPGLWVAPDKSGLHYDSYGQQGNGQYSGILNNFFSAKDSWVHITWVKEGTQYRFYRNGKLFETKPAPETFYTAKTSYWLGRVDYFFAGAMTEVSIWSVARTEADIQKDMHQHLKGDEPGLSYYWAFNEGNGNTVHERVTRPKDGVIRGATWQQAELPLPIPAHTPRAIAPVLAFDGVDDSVEVQDPFQNNTTFSICLWVKPSVKDDGARHGILGKTGDENLKPSLWVAEYDSALQYDSYTPAGKNRYSQVLSNFFTALDQWVHIAWVKQGSEYRFYRNGELFATKPAPATFYTAATSYLIGRVDNFFAGQMTEVSVWSVARTQEDIQKDMHRRLKGDEAGLAYYWAFNEGSGNTAHDKAKNAKHGTINGATWQEAAVPVASPEPAAATSKPKVLQPLLAFDGKDDFVELPALSLPSGNEITVSFWAYVDDLFYGDATVISGVDSANRLGLTITAPINSREISFLDGGDGISQPILFTEYRGKWSHWALTKNATAGEMKIYRNGELFHSATGKTVPLAPMAKVVLGKRPDHNMSYYQGKLKDVSIWSRARSQEEIKADMNRPLVGNEAGLVGYWPLNEGTGTVVNDRTSNANHGTIQGATWQQAEGPGASPQPAFAKVLQPVLAFDGVDDYVETPDPFDSTTNFTISLWNYRIHPAMSSGAIMGKSGGGEKYLKPTVLSFGATRLVYNLCSSDGKASTKLVEGFFADQEPWLHITWVKEGKEVRIYRNGELFGTYSAPDNFYTSSKTCYWLGRWGGTTGGNLLGYITDVNIWSVARTQADIQKDMRRRLQGDEPGLCYYLPLNEASGTTAFDLANRPNHGKIIGATWQQSEVPIASPPAEQKVP